VLPRGFQLLKRLQASVDRSSKLMEELDERNKNCNAMLDSLIFLATKDEREKAKLEQKKKQAALADRLSGKQQQQTPSPHHSNNNNNFSSPSPIAANNNTNRTAQSTSARHHHNQQQQHDSLNDTFAALAYSASPPPRNGQSDAIVNLDDTFAGFSPSGL
jgi:hypothetical protein